MTMLGKLNVVVVNGFNRTEGPHGVVKKPYTDISIRLGEQVIATRKAGGTYNQGQALTEFKRFPERFTPQGETKMDTLMALAA